MLQILAILTCAIAVISLLLFKASSIFTFAAIGLAAVGLVLAFFNKNKIIKLLSVAFIVASCVALCLSSYDAEANPYAAYMKQYHKAEKLVESDPAKARKILDEAEEIFSLNSYDKYPLYAKSYLAEDNYEECYEYLDKGRSCGYLYYDELGKLYLAAGQTGKDYSFLKKDEDYSKKIQEIYLDAVEEMPSWYYPKEVCGMYAYENDHRLKIAQYYLLGSLGQYEICGDTWFYLGSVYYDNMNYNSAKECFKLAEKYKHTDKIGESIKYYQNLLKEEGK